MRASTTNTIAVQKMLNVSVVTQTDARTPRYHNSDTSRERKVTWTGADTVVPHAVDTRQEYAPTKSSEKSLIRSTGPVSPSISMSSINHCTSHATMDRKVL
jgi:hypothetical protein